MSTRTLTINHANGGSETYNIKTEDVLGVRSMTVDGETLTIDRTAPAIVRSIIADGETITIDTTSEGIRTLIVDGETITIDRTEEANVINFLNQLWTRQSRNIFNKDDAVDNTGGSDDWNDYFQSASMTVVGGESYNQSSGEAIISEYDDGSTSPDHLTLQSGSGTDYSDLMWFGGSQSVTYSSRLIDLSHARDFSLSFNWISGSDTTSLQYLIANANNASNTFTLGTSAGGKLNAYSFNGSYFGQTTISFEPNTFYFVMVVKDGSDIVINLNGVDSGSFSGSLYRPPSGFAIGSRADGASSIQGGSIWNVKVYSDTSFTTQVFGASGEGISSSDWDDSIGSLTATINGSPSPIGANTGDVSTSSAGAISLQETTTSISLMAPIADKDTCMVKKGSGAPDVYESYGTITNSFADKSLFMVSYGDSVTEQATWQSTTMTALNLNHVKRGVGGRRVTGSVGLAAQASIDTIPFTANLVVAMGGTNDWVGGVSLGSSGSTDINEFYGALNLMIDRIILRCSQAQVILMTPPYSEDILPLWSGFTDKLTNGAGLTLSDYSDAIKVVAAARGLPVVDNYNNSWDEDSISTYMTNDGNYIHPNADGGEIIGNNLAQVIVDI